MKQLSIIGAAALLANTMLVAPAFADTIPTPTADAADGTTTAAMQTQCDTLAAAHDIDGIGTGDIWSGAVVPGLITLISGPTEVAGTRDIDESSIVGTGTFTPGTTYIQGDPFRIGGSVNMFGDQYATSGSWSDSTYNYTADFNSTFAHAFDCDISQSVYHPAVVIPGHPVEGYYTNTIDNGNGDCQGLSPANPHWGEDIGACKFTKTGDAVDDQNDPEYWDPAAVVTTEAGTPVNQDQTDTLTAFEDHGGPVQANGGPFHIGQVVICISPTTSTQTKKGVPGTWVAKNGYTSTKCTTAWMSVAPWGAGTENSNGTYISVPDYTLYNL